MLSTKKIVSFDLDGTLAVSKSPMTKEMADLLTRLLIYKKVAVISGGSFTQFKTQFLPHFEAGGNATNISNLILLPTSGSQRYEFDKNKMDWERTDFEPFQSELKEKAKMLLEQVITSGEYDIPVNPKGEYIEDRDTQISLSALGQQAPIEEKAVWDPTQEKRQ
ncbi:HAD family hydrolase, partial [Patescibacteria group bacterium]|nr:HAD family hydrolase [Patescibacteria group bacterium]